MSLAEWVKSLQLTWPVIHRALEDVRDTQKKYTDKKRSQQKEFKVRDEVFPQNSCNPDNPWRNRPKYAGPFPIIKIINPATVEVKLSKNFQHIHPVFHCSLLKPANTLPLCPATKLPPPPILIEGEQFDVKEILDSQTNRCKFQYLILWKDFPPSEIGWVDTKHVRSPYLLCKFHNWYPDKPH